MEGCKEVKERPEIIQGRTFKITSNCGNCYITVNHLGAEGTDSYRIIEVFATLGKTGGCASALLQGLTRMVSLALRADVPLEKIIATLKGVSCPSPIFGNTFLGKGVTKSCVDAVARVLQLEQQNYPSHISDDELNSKDDSNGIC